MNKKLKKKKTGVRKWGWAKNTKLVNRLLYTNPTPIYNRVTIDPYKRHQEKTFTIKDLFTKTPGKCLCGCNKELTGRRTVWATDECSQYGWLLYCIIKGRVEIITTLIHIYQGYYCKHCGQDLSKVKTELDHIIPVHKGGGGSWLSNYQLLCVDCHKAKTKQDVKKSL